MHISSKAGTEIFKNEYQIIDGINGIPTLETDYSQLKYNHPEPMVMLSNAYDDRFIMIIKEQESVAESSRLRLTGVHSFIYDFSLDRIYEEYTQYFSLENILSLLFDGTDYTFEVKSDIYYYALDFQNFGDNDKMSLINQICDRWELEYHVTGNKVVFGQRRGRETTKQFRYKMNIADSSVNLDISEGATYIRAYFGKKDEENPENSTYTEREMTHPLAEDFGIRHAKPYSNENITQEETMDRYMKMKIEGTWKLSVEIDVTELIGDGEAEVGNTVWAIDERMDLEYKTRIIELKRYYNKDDKVYKTKATLGNKTFIEAVSEQEVTQGEVEEVARYTNRLIENLKAQFDNDFNSERDALRQMVSDATDAAHAEIEASEQRMTELIGNERASLQTEIDDKTNDAREYADAQIADKEAQYEADWNQRDADIQQTIETVVGGSVDGLGMSITQMQEDYLQKTDFVLEPDGFLLGGNYVGGDHYSTAIVGSANGIDILADEMRLTGDLLVQGDVEAYALDVVEGNFGRLWADEFNATTITGDHIDGETITGRHLSVDSAMVDKLFASSVLADNVRTLGIEAVRGDIADLRSRILTADVITTDHIRWNNALFNRLTGDEAFIDRLEVKAANIRDLSAVDFVGNRITQSAGGSHTLEMHRGYLSSYNNGELNLRFGRYDLEFYNRENEQIGWFGPSVHAYDPNRRGIALTVENDYFTLGIRRQGLIRPVLTTTQSGRTTALSGPFGGAIPGASLNLYANRRLVSTDTDYEVDASAIDQPSIIMDQSEDTNTMHQYFGGMNRRYGAIWQVRWRESSGSSSRRIEANDSGVILQGDIGITGNLYSLNSGNDYWENDSGSNTLSSSNSSFHVGGVRVRRNFSHLYLGTNDGGELRVTNGDGRNQNGSGPIYRDIRFRNWTAVSSEKYKTDITEWDYSALDVIKDEMSIYQYKYTDDDKSIDNAKDFYQRGLIVERNTPIEWIAGDGINQYEVTAWTLKGLQEVAHITDDHETRIEQLERENVELKQQLSELKGA